MSITVQDTLNRDSREAFEESTARLEALFQNTGNTGLDDELTEEEQELPSQLLDTEDDDLDEYGEMSLDNLHEEASDLLDQAEEILPAITGAGRTRLKKP